MTTFVLVDVDASDGVQLHGKIHFNFSIMFVKMMIPLCLRAKIVENDHFDYSVLDHQVSLIRAVPVQYFAQHYSHGLQKQSAFQSVASR